MLDEANPNRSRPMRLVVISNRVRVPSDEGQAGGLAVALQDALAERGGVWLGWDGGGPHARADEARVEYRDGITFVTLPLTDGDLERYYRGYANSVLWPLFHERLDAMDHRRAFRRSYRSVNRYFAHHVRDLIRDDDVVWVQDYHLIPLGGELRRHGVSGRIGFFLHTPFPPFDVFRALPAASDMVEAFFAYDLVGLQTSTDRRHFAETLRRTGAEVREEDGVAELTGRRLRFDVFPVGIDVDRTSELAEANRDTETARGLLRTKGDGKLLIGADRLDYTKGLIARLRAFDRFLKRHRDSFDGRATYIQIAAPSRESVDEYRAMMSRLSAEAGRINARTNRIGWTPFRLIHRSVPRDQLLGYFALSDVGLVTPVRDGMNLVAKEFLASQPPDDPGVLVLSNLAGAAEELDHAAVLVNPYDIAGVAEGIHRALTMTPPERRDLWEAGMDRLRANTARTWRTRFLETLDWWCDEPRAERTPLNSEARPPSRRGRSPPPRPAPPPSPPAGDRESARPPRRSGSRNA